MLIRKEYLNEDCLIGIWKIDETKEELYSLLSPRTKEFANQQLTKIKSNKRTLEWLSTRLIIRHLTNDDKIVKHTSQGQPYLSDKSYHISISHSDQYAVVLLHKNRKVGVDIESFSPRILRVEDRFISEGEYIDPNNRLLHLILHWCTKETLYKLMNSTKIIFKDHLHIHPFQLSNKGIIKASESLTEFNEEYNINYEVSADYVLTWGIH